MTRLDRDLGEARQRLTQDLAGAQDRAIYTLVIAAVLSLAIAIVLGTAVTRSIKGPLSSLDRGARALTAGDFSHRLPAEGQDELTELAHAFNRMASEINELSPRCVLSIRMSSPPGWRLRSIRGNLPRQTPICSNSHIPRATTCRNRFAS